MTVTLDSHLPAIVERLQESTDRRHCEVDLREMLPAVSPFFIALQFSDDFTKRNAQIIIDNLASSANDAPKAVSSGSSAWWARK